jgi:hypothetical protein
VARLASRAPKGVRGHLRARPATEGRSFTGRLPLIFRIADSCSREYGKVRSAACFPLFHAPDSGGEIEELHVCTVQLLLICENNSRIRLPARMSIGQFSSVPVSRRLAAFRLNLTRDNVCFLLAARSPSNVR